MTPARPAPRPRARGSRAASPPPAEGWLRALGADPAFAEAVLGDLAEEFAERAARDGVGPARRWYAREALRSAPHLLRSWLRRAGPHQRARVAAYVAAGVVGTAVLVLALRSIGAGPPARLEAGTSDPAEGIVVNAVRPVQLPVRVLDAAGRLLGSEGVRYRWAAGTPVDVSPAGVITCAARGDATVRASLGPLATDLRVRCRPVREIRADMWVDLLVGEPPHELPVQFVGVDGRPVTLIAGHLRIEDSTVATLRGLHLRPLVPGRTYLRLAVGNETAGGAVTVFAPARTLEGLRPDQRYVGVPVRLAPGQAVRWPLPVGLFWLANRGGPAGQPAPVLSVDGPLMCLPAPGPTVYRTHCLARGPGAHVTVAHPGSGAGDAVGTILLEREGGR
jgi:hypothetical protein